MSTGWSDRRAFADALRAAIDERDVTLVWLRDRLAERSVQVSLGTLSYWRSGSRTPDGADSVATVRAIEEVLGVEPYALTSRLGPPRRVGDVGDADYPFEVDRLQVVEETMEAMGSAPFDRLRILSAHLVADVDQHGNLRRVHGRYLTQVMAGTVFEMPYVEVAAAPTDEWPHVTGAFGAHITREYVHPSRQAFGMVSALDSPVTAPDTMLGEGTLNYPEGYPGEREIGYWVTREMREVLLWVRFHPDALPTWCEVYTTAPATARQLDLGSGTSAHAVRRRFGPSVLGIRWGYE
ncbi:MAG TPA: hypothetical protein VNS46_21350 [Nocardioides sp.]|nr:hypothetical protein [Nocardioides sp.]